jgi:hypothetical protein
MLHFAPAVVGNTNHPKSVTIIKGFPFAYRLFGDSAAVLSKNRKQACVGNRYAKLVDLLRSRLSLLTESTS